MEESVSIHRTEAVKTSAAFSGLQKIAVAVGSAVCVGAVICICFWAIGRGGNANNEAKNDKGSYSSTSKPSFQRSKVNADNTRDGKNTASTLVAPKTAAVLPPPPEKDWQTLQREAMARKLGRKKEHEIAYNDSNATDGNGRKPIHRNSTEHIMSMIFTTGLGEMPPPLPNVPERDKQRMAQILLDKYEIQPGDPDAEESDPWGSFYLHPDEVEPGYYDFVFLYGNKVIATMLTKFYKPNEICEKSDSELENLMKQPVKQ